MRTQNCALCGKPFIRGLSGRFRVWLNGDDLLDVCDTCISQLHKASSISVNREWNDIKKRSIKPKMIVYISGPIDGIKNRNKPAFIAAQNTIISVMKDAGYLEVINPVLIGEQVDAKFAELSKEIGGNIKPTKDDYMKADIAEMMRATHVFLLKGYKNSVGCSIEIFIAQHLNMKIVNTFEELVQSYENAKKTGTYGESCKNNAIGKEIKDV